MHMPAFLKDPMVLSTIAIAIATIANVLISRGLWQVTQDSMEISRRAFASAQRPYLCVSRCELRLQNVGTANVILTFKNYGSVPASSVEEDLRLFVTGVEQPRRNLPIGRYILSPQIENQLIQGIDGAALVSGIETGNAVLETVATFKYRSSMGQTYCFREKSRFDHVHNRFWLVENSEETT